MPDLKKLNEIIKDAPPDRHSFFQLRYFVIGKEPTIQAKLWRCLREMKSRKESLDALVLEVENVNDELIIIEEDIKHYIDRSPKGMAQIRILERKKANLQTHLLNLDQKQKDIQEEADFFMECFEILKEQEPLQRFDDEKAQTEYWNHKLAQELELKVLLGSPVDIELMKTILALAEECPVKVQAIKSLEMTKKMLEKH